MVSFDSISLQHGKRILFMETSAAILRGEKIGLIGPNGAGKTTLFRMIMKLEEPDDGRVSVDRNVKIGYFSQDVGEMGGRSVVEETMDGAGKVAEVGRELKLLEAALADPDQADKMDALIEKFSVVQEQYQTLGGYALEGRAREILAGLGLSQSMMDGDVAALSGGWKMRVALARILLMKPDLMLLDEPTNHLDIESIIWLEAYLQAFDGSVLMTSHDREFMNRLVSKIIEIDGGELKTFSGNYTFYEQQKVLLESQAEAQFARQQAMLAKEERFIARFKAQASKAAQVQSRIKKLDKIDKIEPPRQHKKLRFDFPQAPRSGDDVLSVKGIDKGYGEKKIYRDFSWKVRRKERWCVMGANGTGKTTLLKMVAGQETPDRGEVALGANVKLGYFAQHAMEVLDGQKSVYEVLSDTFPMASIGSLRTLAGVFGFSGDEVEKPCRVLSGGEKARVALAKMLYDPPNLLVLDEPTNHLDLDTKELLIDAISKYEGTMIFVSHDRAFLAACSNRVLELNPSGPVLYPGGYTEYVAQSGHEAPGMRVVSGL